MLARFIDGAGDDDDALLDEHYAVDLPHDEREEGFNIKTRRGDWGAPEPTVAAAAVILARLLALNQERSPRGEP